MTTSLPGRHSSSLLQIAAVLDEILLNQGVLFEELAQFTLCNAVYHLFGLALLTDLLAAISNSRSIASAGTSSLFKATGFMAALASQRPYRLRS